MFEVGSNTQARLAVEGTFPSWQGIRSASAQVAGQTVLGVQTAPVQTHEPAVEPVTQLPPTLVQPLSPVAEQVEQGVGPVVPEVAPVVVVDC